MSGIFKGDSIYKIGGGSGGGYKDGGELVDGDFINVENNTVSSYDNESRDQVNFYFEVTEGEIINSIINLYTQVNAVVNVYVLKNGIYYLLGNVGGNTINASKIYKINITDISFDIEEVSDEPEMTGIDYDGVYIPVKKIGDLYWTIANVNNLPCDDYKLRNGQKYYRIGELPSDTNIHGFRIPSRTDYDYLSYLYSANALKSVDLWISNPGTNASGFDAKPYGSIRTDNINEGYTEIAMFYVSDSSEFYINYDGTRGYAAGGFYYNLRLCKNA